VFPLKAAAPIATFEITLPPPLPNVKPLINTSCDVDNEPVIL